MAEKRCCKCGRQLPESYKGKKCERCKGKSVDGIKKFGKFIFAIGAAIGTVVVAVIAGVNKNSDDNQ